MAHAVHVVVDGVARVVSNSPDVDWWGRAATVASAVVALFTGWLAFSTRNLASETADSMRLADRHHQESLAPLIVARDLGVTPGSSRHNIDGGSDWAQQILVTGRIKNIGNGPALQIFAELSFAGCAPEEPVRFNALAPDEDLGLNNSDFNVLLPPGSELPLRAEELLPGREAKPWTFTVSYETPFGMVRRSKYEHVPYAQESHEVLEAVPISIDPSRRPGVSRSW